MNRFQGKTVLVAGGTRGMELAGALRLTSEGATVIVTGQSETGIAEAAAAVPSTVQIVRNDAASPDAGTDLVATPDEDGPRTYAMARL